MPAKKASSLVDEIKAAMAQQHFFASFVAYQTGVGRLRFKRFLEGSATLRDTELSKVQEFLDLGGADNEQQRWRNFEANTAQFDAISEALVKHSLAYLADGVNASGTFVAIGKREFIATTSHTLPSSPTLALIGKGFHPLKRTDIKIVAAGRMKGNHPDVGYIETKPGTAAMLGREPIEVDRLRDAGTGQPGRYAYLFGCPHELIKQGVNHERKERIIGIHSITYPNAVLAVDEWPTVAKDVARPRKTVDLFIPYDISEEFIVVHGSGNRLPNPEGASGGGIWQMAGPKKDGVWHVGKVKLIAIQSAWDKERKYIRCVQIKHWVRLIERNYPDLKKHLGNF